MGAQKLYGADETPVSAAITLLLRLEIPTGIAMFTDAQDYIAEIDGENGNSLCRRLIGEEQLWLKACKQAVTDGRHEWLLEASTKAGNGSRAIQVIERWHTSQMINSRRDAPLVAQEVARVAQFTLNFKNMLAVHQAVGSLIERDVSGSIARSLFNTVREMQRLEGTKDISERIRADEFAREAEGIRRWRGAAGVHLRAILSKLRSLQTGWRVERSRDLILYLLGEESIEHSKEVRVNALLDRPAEVEGQAATIVLQLLQPGSGAIYSAPNMLFFSFDRPFCRATRKALAYATSKFDCRGDVRWYLSLRRSRSEAENLPFRIEGGSIGAAFALGFTHLFDRQRDPIDPNWAITGSITRRGKIKQVGGLFAKLVAARSADLKAIIPAQTTTHPRTGIDILPKSWKKLLRDEIVNQDLANWKQRIRMEVARTVDQASEIATEKMSEVILYLETLRANLSVLPRYYPRSFEFDFARIRQRVRVSTERLRSRNVESQSPKSRDRLIRGAESFSSEAILDWDKVVPRLERAVILGDAGSGKTWLLKYEGWRLAGDQLGMLHQGEIGVDEIEIPIFIRLGELIREVTNYVGDPLEGILRIVSRGYLISSQLLKQSLESGKALLLLDAFDEVGSELRDQLVAVLDRLGNLRCRVFISSRIAGYQPVLRLRHDETQREVEVVAFEPEQIGLFIDGWFSSLPNLIADSESSQSSRKRWEDRARDLRVLLRDNPPLQTLGRIPLLLTFICLLAGEPNSMPFRRSDIYKEILLRLLQGSWRDKSDSNVDRREKKLEILRAIAWHFAGGGDEDKWVDLMSGVELAQVISDVPGWKEIRKNTDPPDQSGLEILSERDGVLLKAGDPDFRGGDLDVPYLFLHRSFHEYLLAEFLARQPREYWQSAVDNHCWDEDWHDVIVLLSSILKPEDAALLLRTLIEQENDSFNTMLLLAGRCLGEIMEAGLERIEIASEVKRRVTALLTSNVEYERDRASKVLARARLIPGATTFDFPAGIREAYLKEGRADNELLRPTFKNFLETLRWGSYSDRRSAVKELISRRDVRATNTLLTLLDDEDRLVRIIVCEALGELRESRAVVHLLELLLDRDKSVQVSAVSALGKIGDLRATQPLLDLVSRRRDSVRQTAIEALGLLGDSRAMIALGQILVDPKERAGVRAVAARALGSLGGDEVIDALFEGIKELRYPLVRKASVESLGYLGDMRAIEYLLPLICDDNQEVSTAARKALKLLANEPRKAESIYEASIARLKQAPKRYVKDMRCRDNLHDLLAQIFPLVRAADKGQWPSRRKLYASTLGRS